MTNKQQARALVTEQREGEYWITGHDPEIGPYATRREAEEDRVGVAKFYRHEAGEEIAPAEEFKLENDEPKTHKAEEFFGLEKTKQAKLITGLDCCKGQMELFGD